MLPVIILEGAAAIRFFERRTDRFLEARKECAGMLYTFRDHFSSSAESVPSVIL
jgi:hypothetical protein